MARKQPASTTGNTSFTGSEYQEYLNVRNSAMKGFAEGTVDAPTKNAARALVRNARKAIQAAGLTVPEWRELEQVREAELAESRKRARKPRNAKPADESVPEVTEDQAEPQA
jgi:hypothetical protein